MAPTADIGQATTSRLPLWDPVISVFQHPGLLLLASTIALGIWVAKRLHNTREHCHDDWQSLILEHDAMEEKHNHRRPSLSDLLPPLQSVVTSGTLVTATESYQSHLIPTEVSSAAVAPAGPWRRHSYPSSLDCDTPTAEITSDETTYYPIVGDDGNRKPGYWRRRTLVFELPPAGSTVPLESQPVMEDATIQRMTDEDAVDVTDLRKALNGLGTPSAAVE